MSHHAIAQRTARSACHKNGIELSSFRRATFLAHKPRRKKHSALSERNDAPGNFGAYRCGKHRNKSFVAAKKIAQGTSQRINLQARRHARNPGNNHFV